MSACVSSAWYVFVEEMRGEFNSVPVVTLTQVQGVFCVVMQNYTGLSLSPC